MLQMGFTLKEIQESLSESRYDEVCATYMLLKRDVKEVRTYVKTPVVCITCVCVCVSPTSRRYQWYTCMCVHVHNWGMCITGACA